MKLLSSLFVALILIVSVTGCKNVLSENEESKIGDNFDNDDTNSSIGGGISAEKPLGFQGVMAPINSVNASSYPVAGDCKPDDGPVTVVVGTPDVTEEFPCNPDGTFSGLMDVSTVTASPPTVTLAQDGNTVTPPAGTAPAATDLAGPAAAPTVTAPGGIVSGSTHSLPINCNEAGEVVSITGSGLSPNPQEYVCSAPGAATFPVSIANGVSLNSPNNISLSSQDENGNPSGTTTTFDLPIDNLGPAVLIAAGPNTLLGGTATFTITVVNDSTFTSFTPVASVGTMTSPACTASPCTVTVDGAPLGILTLTVAAGDVSDPSSNTNIGDSESSLTIVNSNLSIQTPMPIMTSNNASSYPVSGVCEPSLGPVSITVGTPNQTISAPCDGGTFTYDANIDASGVTANPPQISVAQGSNNQTVPPADSPINDQVGPLSHATAVGPGGTVAGTTFSMNVTCSELGEKVELSGNGITPNPQEFICPGSGVQVMPLALNPGDDFISPNILTITSRDEYGNLASGPTNSVDVPVDRQGPAVAITGVSDIVQGGVASFTVTVTDTNATGSSFLVNWTGAETGVFFCNANPCIVTTPVVESTGTLNISVGALTVFDNFGNANPIAATDSLTVSPHTLSINTPLPNVNSLSTAYTFSGDCDPSLGDVTMTLSFPFLTINTPCNGPLPGSYSVDMNLSLLNSNPPNIAANQSTNVVEPLAGDLPSVDTIPILIAPPVADVLAVSSISIDTTVNCNEVGEIVTFSSPYLSPTNTQTHTCLTDGVENITLSSSLAGAPDPTLITVSSEDENGNPTTNTSSFSIFYDYPDVSEWGWSFTNGILNGQVISQTNPQIGVVGAPAEDEGVSIQLYDDNTCTNAKGAAQVITGGAASYLDITYLGNGTQDGPKEYYAIAINSAGLIAPCVSVNINYILDRVVNPPTASGGVLCGETSGPQPNINVACEPGSNVVASLGAGSTAVMTPASASGLCSPAGQAVIPLSFSTNGVANIELSQTDVPGNTSTASICTSTITPVTNVARTSLDQTIIFDNKTSFPMSGTCSHAGTGNVRISGQFIGSPITVDCALDETWTATLDFTPLSDNDLSTDDVTITHQPGFGAVNSSVVTNLDNCRATSELTIHQNGRSTRLYNFKFEVVGGASQIPIWEFGDGTPDQQLSGNMNHDYPVYTGVNQTYNLKIKHCPEEVREINYTYQLSGGWDRNLFVADFTDLLPAGEIEYSAMERFYLNQGSNDDTIYGLAGTAYDPDNFPNLNLYNIFYQSNMTALPVDINCSGKVLTNMRIYLAAAGSNPLVHPIMGLDCYDSLTYYDLFSYTTGGNTAGQVFTGQAMSPTSFTSALGYYRVSRVAVNVDIGPIVNMPSLTRLEVSHLNTYGGVATGAQIPYLTGSNALREFHLIDLGWAPLLPTDHGDSIPDSIVNFNISNDLVSGTITKDYLINVDDGLTSFTLVNLNVSGDIPTVSHMTTLVTYQIYNTLLNVDVWPDISMHPNISTFRYHDNLMSNSAAPYTFHDLSTTPKMRIFRIGDVDFGGANFSASDLATTNMHDLYLFRTNLSITSITIPTTTPNNDLRWLTLQGNTYTGTLAGLEVGPNVSSRLYQVNMRATNLNQTQCDHMFDYIYNNRAILTGNSIYRVDYFMISGNACAFSADQVDKINGTGAYEGDGLISVYNLYPRG